MSSARPRPSRFRLPRGGEDASARSRSRHSSNWTTAVPVASAVWARSDCGSSSPSRWAGSPRATTNEDTVPDESPNQELRLGFDTQARLG